MNNNILDTVVRIDKAQYTLFELTQIYKKLDKRPSKEWQDSSTKSKLIESILMGIPIPPLYFFEDRYGEFDILDGIGRVATIIEFLQGEFNLTNLTYLPTLNGKQFDKLTPILRAKLEDYKILVNIIQPPISDTLKQDIIERLNPKERG